MQFRFVFGRFFSFFDLSWVEKGPSGTNLFAWCCASGASFAENALALLQSARPQIDLVKKKEEEVGVLFLLTFCSQVSIKYCFASQVDACRAGEIGAQRRW